MLQTRNGKRTGVAALRVAIEMEAEGLITPDEAVLMVEPRHLDQLLHPNFVNEKVRRSGGMCVFVCVWGGDARLL